MKKFTQFEQIYLGILTGIITLSVILYFLMDALIAFVIFLIGIIIAIFNNVLKPYQKELEEKNKDIKKVQELYIILKELIEHLESKEYWDNHEINDEKVNTKISQVVDNIEDFRKYLGLNIINEERGKFNKTITILEGRFILKFRNHSPYESFINKKGRVKGPFKLYEGDTTSLEIKNLLLTEIKDKLKKKFVLDIVS